MRGSAAGTVAVAAVLLSAAGCLRAPDVKDIGVSAAPAVVRAAYSVDWWTKLVPAKALFEPGSQFLEVNPRELATPALDPDSGRLIVGTRDGILRSVGEGGQVAWAFTARGPFEAGATIQDGVVYAACADGTLSALNAKDGTLQWQYDAKEELATQPVLAGDKVLVAAQSDVVLAVDAKTGKWLWQYRRDTPSGFTIRGASRPTVHKDVAFVGFSDGDLVALNVEDGSVKWERELSKGGSYVDVDTSPLLDGSGQLYAASYKDGLYALEAETGAVKWQAPEGGLAHLSATGDLIVGAGDQEVVAFDRLSGQKLWTLAVKDTDARRAAVARGYLLVPVNRALLFVNPVNGHTEITWDPGDGVSATPLVKGQHMYVLSNLGYLYAFRFSRSSG
ncbi:MAG TPA: PQQ-binding-like beta-propeller repeat protein [Myxococcaceae bacterium]|jgi:outer membrane protein assembly factor BamB